MKAKRSLAILLSACFVLASAAGCGNSTPSESASVPVTQPGSSADATAKEPVVLKGFGCSYPGQAPWENMMLFNELEKRTGIKVEWEYLEQNPQTKERVNMMFAGGTMPDVFIRAGQGAALREDVIKWGNAGLVIDMVPYLDQYAPNIKAMFDKYPAVKASNMTPDGKIYVLPTVYDYKPYQVWRIMQMNTAWLEKVGKKMPTTLDEFTDVLKAFRDQDANGNGDPNDEIPYSAHNFPITMRGILPGFGLNYAYDMPVVFKDNKVSFAATSDEFKEALKYLNMLYSEKLLDAEIFSQTNARYHGFMPDNKFGAMMLHQTLNAGEVAKDLKGMEPLIGPAGAENRVWSFYNPVVYNNCSAFITSNCKNPETAMQYLDYMYLQEGSDLTWLGLEGETYVPGENGQFKYTEKIATDPKGFAAAMGAYSIVWGGGSEPGLFSERQLFPGVSLTTMLENCQQVEPFLQEVASTPLPIMSPAEENKYKNLTQELNTYKNEMWAKFVTGEVSFDKWDDYCKQMNSLGYAEIESLVKNATGL